MKLGPITASCVRVHIALLDLYGFLSGTPEQVLDDLPLRGQLRSHYIFNMSLHCVVHRHQQPPPLAPRHPTHRFAPMVACAVYVFVLWPQPPNYPCATSQASPPPRHARMRSGSSTSILYHWAPSAGQPQIACAARRCTAGNASAVLLGIATPSTAPTRPPCLHHYPLRPLHLRQCRQVRPPHVHRCHSRHASTTSRRELQ